MKCVTCNDDCGGGYYAGTYEDSWIPCKRPVVHPLTKKLESCPVKVGQTYLHYKGGSYRIVSVGFYEPTTELMIAYQSEETGYIWFRAYSDFNSTIIKTGTKRFTRA